MQKLKNQKRYTIVKTTNDKKTEKIQCIRLLTIKTPFPNMPVSGVESLFEYSKKTNKPRYHILSIFAHGKSKQCVDEPDAPFSYN